MNERLQGRVGRIALAMEKLERLMGDNPDSPKQEAWTRKWNEFATSLSNIQEFGKERAPTGNPVGVKIDVPVDFMELKSFEPGA